MKRISFLKSVSIMGVFSPLMNLSTLVNLDLSESTSEKMPVLFLGHGSPMNAIEDNIFVRNIQEVTSKIPVPNAIICISAHWETRGTMLTAMEKPRTIHDFGGFPKALFEVRYPADGNPKLANEMKHSLPQAHFELDYDWGLDHGAWSVIKHLYPKANVPVIQLSLDKLKSPAEHYELAQQLSNLRNKGVLIIGSGNIIHNLRLANFQRINDLDYGYDWAIEVKEKTNNWILEGNHEQLIHYKNSGLSFDYAIPTPEHYLPLLYTLGLKEKTDNVTLFNDMTLAGSLSMTSVLIQ